MNRIGELFLRKKKDVLAVYFTAGFPKSENVTEAVGVLAEAGVDLVEVGMPFSDPLADGPVIQQSSAVALENGMTIARLFSELKQLRAVTQVPVVLMGYLNPVIQFGVEAFLERCRSCGVDGVILPDLPVEEFENYSALFEEHAVHPVFLVSPSTPKDRVELIASKSRGFVYVVSSSSTTGANAAISADQQEQLAAVISRIKNIPVMVGFGIHDRSSFQRATKNAAGGIVGSAFIRELQESDFTTAINTLTQKIKPLSHDYSIVR